ncbi:hypothetical protein OEA41_006706 [Lepraria neglecta]|uniref:Uncharacterized protein n=1 Tax=Lepraria neglecta TaxID=209136 RepID=A0AAD9ZBR9_9LECA|nr:hypothetical protein OEA41_006706 [Lepraria neglecta]
MAASTSKPQEAVNMYEDYSSGRHLSETVEAFLRRLPPLSTSIMDYGPWIYCASPYASKGNGPEDQATLVRRGRQLLKKFTALKAGIEASMPGKSKGVITRQLDVDWTGHTTPQAIRTRPSRPRARNRLHVRQMDAIPLPPDLNTAWSLVAHGTVAGELGHAAKVATDDGSQNARLICIYTPDFGDKEDVKRVLERILAMGLCNRNGAIGEGKAIYYKADAYTYLELMGGNEFGLKTSLFSNREVLAEGK